MSRWACLVSQPLLMTKLTCPAHTHTHRNGVVDAGSDHGLDARRAEGHWSCSGWLPFPLPPFRMWDMSVLFTVVVTLWFQHIPQHFHGNACDCA